MNQLKQALTLLLILSTFQLMAQSNTYLKKYAGTYQLLANGQKATPTSDKYVFTPDGKCTWTMFTPDGSGSNAPQVTKGTWKASEGLIQMSFSMGEGEGSELLTDFQLLDGVFRSESVYLKKVVPKPAAKATGKK